MNVQPKKTKGIRVSEANHYKGEMKLRGRWEDRERGEGVLKRTVVIKVIQIGDRARMFNEHRLSRIFTTGSSPPTGSSRLL